ncbi:MAG: hypothetical protein LQ338_006263, partial [Usnochroma carphineum]
MSTEGIGVTFQVLKEQQNFLRWPPDFKEVAHAKGPWDLISQKELLHAPPNREDFAFKKAQEGNSALPDDK